MEGEFVRVTPFSAIRVEEHDVNIPSESFIFILCVHFHIFQFPSRSGFLRETLYLNMEKFRSGEGEREKFSD